MILFLFIYYNYLLVLLNLGAKVRIFLYRCTTFYCSIPVIYTYLGIILEASMIFIYRCLQMVSYIRNKTKNHKSIMYICSCTSHLKNYAFIFSNL